MLKFDLIRLQNDLLSFLPELILCGTIVLLLLLRLFRGLDRFHLGGIALALSLVAVLAAWGQWVGWFGLRTPESHRNSVDGLFSGLLVYDSFTVFMRIFLLSFAVLIIYLSMMTGIPDREDSADFYTLILGATLGMSIMSSANHLLMVFMGVEMASLPSYALAGFLKGRKSSSEAALKYVVYGGGAAGIMLYGISLLAGKFGTGSLPHLASEYASAIQPGMPFDPVILLGTLFVIIGLAFKLSAVPFHFWCPDVFEGACAEVAGFLSVASKGAALALTGRLLFTLAGLDDGVFRFAKIQEVADPVKFWTAVSQYLLPPLALLAAITATYGNLAAYMQTNLKRLLAYSTIAHAGYMIMGLATIRSDGIGAVLFYLIAYLFTNLGAFAVVAFIRNATGSEELPALRGLIRRSPVLTLALAAFMLSLLGVPPMVGFAAKFQIFRVLYDGSLYYQNAGEPALGVILFALLLIAGFNTVLSVFYYLKVLKVTIIETTLDEVEGREPSPLPVRTDALLYTAVLAVVVLVVGILWDPLARVSARAVDRFNTSPGVRPAAMAQNAPEVRP